MEPGVFLTALTIVGATAVLVVRSITGAISGRRGSQADLARLREQLDEQHAALDDAHAALADQAAQLAELQERMDFTDRMLTQGRDRSALPPHEKREQ